jgi:hypothetical protein
MKCPVFETENISYCLSSYQLKESPIGVKIAEKSLAGKSYYLLER